MHTSVFLGRKIIVHKNYNYNVLGLSGHWMEFDSSATAEYYGDCFFPFCLYFYVITCTGCLGVKCVQAFQPTKYSLNVLKS